MEDAKTDSVNLAVNLGEGAVASREHGSVPHEYPKISAMLASGTGGFLDAEKFPQVFEQSGHLDKPAETATDTSLKALEPLVCTHGTFGSCHECDPERFPFPPRDPSKPAEQQGIFHKFSVTRVDGRDQPGGKHYGCRYYVLDLVHDRAAPAAMRAYAAEVADTHPQLAKDIQAEFGGHPAQIEMVPEWALRSQIEISNDLRTQLETAQRKIVASQSLDEKAAAALSEFRAVMQNETIPAIVETMRKRAEAGAEIEHLPLNSGISSNEPQAK